MPKCLRCGRKLKSPKSIEHLYGPTCWKKIYVKKNHYPSLEYWFKQ